MVPLVVSSTKTYADSKSLLIQTDKALQELGKQSENVDETIFALDPDWVSGGDIAASEQPLLKELTEGLSLNPQGFVVTSEALYQQAVQHEPLVSSIFIDVRATELMVLLVLRGTLLGVQKVGRSPDITADLTEALARFQEVLGHDHLPSKLQLLSPDMSSIDLQQLEQALLSGDWFHQLPFLHQPEVHITQPGFLMHQLATQASQSLLKDQGLMAQPQHQPQHQPHPQGQALPQPKSGSQPVHQPHHQFQAQDSEQSSDHHQPNQSDTLVDPKANAEFGFSSFQADALQGGNLTAVESNDMIDAEPRKAVMEDEEQKESPQKQSPEKKPLLQTIKGWFIQDVSSANNTGDTLHSSGFSQVFTPTDTARHHDWVDQGVHDTKLKKKLPYKPFIALGVILGLVFLALGTVVYAQVQHRVLIEIELATDTVSADTTIQLDPTASSPDPAASILPAEVTSLEISGSDFIEASGIKLIGEKATGTVTLFNKTTSDKTFEEGTKLITNGLSYSLDEEVKVASASVEKQSGGETKTFGKATVSVTADEIGAESNLEEETKLTVASFDTSTYEAEAEDGLDGGSSREVQVVSATDLTELQESLTAKLVEEAETKLREQAQPGQYFVTTGKVETTSATFDAEEGDEVQTVELNLSLTVEAFGYRVDDLKPFATALLSSKVPSGFELSSEDPQILSTPLESDEPTSTGVEGVIQLEANISAEVVPMLDLVQLKNDVAGKPNPQALSALENNPAIKSLEYVVAPNAFRQFYTSFPRSSQKIQIEIKE